jgi:arabinogalactan endo-1,4-beta-galactosidase
MKHRFLTALGFVSLLASSHCSSPGESPGSSGGASSSTSSGVGGSGISGSGGTSFGAGSASGGSAGNGAGGASVGSGGTLGGATAGGASNSGGSSGAAGAAGASGSGGSSGSGPFEPAFILGADISSVQEAIDGGAEYIDTDGVKKSIFDLLKNHGFNYIRLRTFVDPGAPYGYAEGTGGSCVKDEDYCDKAHTVEFAQQVKAAGMGLLLDFHYSDTWADPGKQIVPAAWRSAGTIAERAALLKAYTKDVLGALVTAGARPDMVQVGNEITPGMLIHVPDSDTDCWGSGSTTTTPNGVASNGNWDNLATLLKAGIEGVREIDADIKVMLHIENTDDVDGAVWWVESARSRGVEFDVLGLSCYTMFQGQPSVWENTFETLAEEFPELSFAIAEYNPERTQANQIMKNLPDGRGLGTFFWEPTLSGEWGESMFDDANGDYTAKTSDFAEYDALKADLGL